jgi:predicted NBD/HSP70 family sugar kinase
MQFGVSANEKRVLDVVCRLGPIARTDIAAATGLTGASVTRLTRDLEGRGLVTDQVLRDGSRGQPMRPVSLKADGAFSVGVNFSHTYVEIGLVDLSGRIVSVEQRPLIGRSPHHLVDAARASIMAQVAQTGIDAERIVGAGFALPGDFSATRPFLSAHAYFPELLSRDIQAELAAGLPMPVYIENDAASAAIGERIHGIGRQHETFLFVHLGHGVGGGIVIDGRLYRGAHGNAGIIGLLFPNDRPRPSGQDLFEHLKRSGLPVEDFPDLQNLWPDTCAPLSTWLDQAARQLAEGVEVIARALDPQAVILGGRLPRHLIEALDQRMGANAFQLSRHLPLPHVLTSRLGSRAGVIGAASLPMFANFFSQGAGEQHLSE